MLQSILNETLWAMEPGALHQFMLQVRQNMNANAEISQDMASFPGENEGGKPYRIENGIAVIEIRGRLMKRASGFIAWLLGIKGMEAIGKDFKQALSDPEVKGIFLDTDSPGGSADGTFDLADVVYSGRGQKPILAFADGHMTSAAMAIGSSADYIVAANEITSLGSIGVFGVHLDIADRAKELGIRPTVFSAGKYKAIGNEFEHLSASDKKHIQEAFDHSHAIFINLMSRNLGIPVDQMDGDLKEAKVFMGSQAISVGLAHEVAGKEKAMTLLRDVVEKKTTFAGRRAVKGNTYKPVATKTAATAPVMRFKGADLVAVIKTVNGCESTDKLAEVEPELVAEADRRKEKAENHLQVSAAETFKTQCQQIVDFRRRQILSKPIAVKEKQLYEIGKAIGKK